MDWMDILCSKPRKIPSVLSWQLKGWSSFNRDGERRGGVCLKAVTLAQSTKMSFVKRRLKSET